MKKINILKTIMIILDIIVIPLLVISLLTLNCSLFGVLLRMCFVDLGRVNVGTFLFELIVTFEFDAVVFSVSGKLFRLFKVLLLLVLL